MPKVHCFTCNKIFSLSQYRMNKNIRNFCGRPCFASFLLNKDLSKEWRNNLKLARGNVVMSEETCKKISDSHLGESNPLWKGDKVGYNALHNWVKRLFPKTLLCECCKQEPARDLANKGTYDRNLENWEWLCRRCHMVKDGRINNLKQFKVDSLSS